jgi:plastocyanin
MPRRRPPRRALVVAMAVVMASSLAACGGDDDDSDSSSDPGVVEVDDNVFEPDDVEVKVGDTVTWRWVGQTDHNVISEEKDLFKSPTQKDGEFEHTFEEAGTFEYTCTIHPGMNGNVTVAEL